MRTLAVLTIAILSLTAGCGETSATGPGGAEVVPASAALFLSVRTDPGSDQWQQAGDLIEKFPDGDRVVSWVVDRLGAEGIDFARDVEPALGPETNIVGLDLSGEGEFVGLTQPDDVEKLHDVFAKLEQSLVTRQIDGWTAFAESDAVLDHFESAREDGTLSGSRDFEEAMGNVDEDALVLVYLNGGAVQETLQQEEGLSPGASDALFAGEIPSFALSLGADGDGVKVEGAAPVSDDAVALENFEADLPEEVPGGALAYVGVNNLESAFSSFRDALAEAAPDFDRDVARIEAELGVSLEEDVFPLFAEESALYVRPGFLIPEVTLVTHVEDEDAAMETVSKLVDGLSEYLPAAQQANDVDIDGVAAKEIPVAPPISLYFAAFDGHLVVTTTRDGISELTQSDDRLADDPDFKDALDQAGMPDETAGFAYVNLHDAIPYVLNLVGDVPDEVRRNLEPLDSLVVYATKDGSTIRFAGLLGVD